MNQKVDQFLAKAKKWGKEMEMLREIALDCKLDEDFKWGNPCYTQDGKNIVLIHAFKEYCAFLFFKGAVLNNEAGLLIQQTENVQAARQIRFTSIQDVAENRELLKKYIIQAKEIEKAGIKVELKKTREFVVTEEFQKALDEDDILKTAFEKLTPGRQRAYLLHFSSPKQAKTRESRIEKAYDDILAGKGLNE